MTFFPPEWKCLRAAMPRLELLYDLPLLLSAHLVEVQTNLLLPTMHTVSIMRTAASEAMPLRQAIPGLIESEVERSYVRVMNRRQSDSEDRSKPSRIATPPGRHPIRQAPQLFELLACNANAFLLDGHTARFLSRERKWGVWSCRPQAASPSRIGAAKLPLPARYGTLFHSKVSPTDPLHST